MNLLKSNITEKAFLMKEKVLRNSAKLYFEILNEHNLRKQ